MSDSLRLPDLADRICEMQKTNALEPSPLMIGIAGAPGAGKTTMARGLVGELNARGYSTAYVPLDGYHLADVELDRLGRRGRKGAIDTFDASGYVSLLRRIKNPDGYTVYAPNFERTFEQPIAGAIPVDPEIQIVLTEGNYLLCPDKPWSETRDLLDEIWHFQVNDEVRKARLIARHVVFGKSHAAAVTWAENVDEPNARMINSWAGRADLRI